MLSIIPATLALTPQNFKNSLRSVGTLVASFSSSSQCSTQNALPRLGDLVQTSGRFRAGNPAIVCYIYAKFNSFPPTTLHTRQQYSHGYILNLMSSVSALTSTLNMQWGNTVFQIPSVTHKEPQPIYTRYKTLKM